MSARSSRPKPDSPRESKKSRTAYHHGDLRRVLLEVATAVVEDEGIDALSLRAVAGRAGVSHAAPYRHFADKHALVAAIAEAGFDELREDIAGAAGRATDARERLVEAAVAYVDFARRRPGRYEVMFRGPRTHAERAVEASDFAFAGLVGLIEAAQVEGALPDANAENMARVAWGLVHGLAELARTDRLFPARGDPSPDPASRGAPVELEGLTRMAARALIEGLASR